MAAEPRASDPVLVALTRHLDAKPRNAVVRRHEAMLRELAFLGERDNENLAFIRSRKWTDQRLSALFSLNCVYQEVLGPLDASARAGQAGLGSQHPIVHGSTRFDAAHSVRVRSAIEDFFTLVGELGFRRDWMTKNTCGDLVFYIARHERESGAGGEPGGRG